MIKAAKKHWKKDRLNTLLSIKKRIAILKSKVQRSQNPRTLSFQIQEKSSWMS